MIKNVYREKRTSKKTGKEYVVLCIEFENGYILDTFLTREQVYILNEVPFLD